MVAAQADDIGGGLRERSAAKFGREEHQRVVEHAAAAQVAQKAGNRAIDPRRFLAVVLPHVFVAIPVDARVAERAAGKELHETHASFQQPSSQQAAAAKIGRLGAIQPIKRMRVARFAGQIRNLRHRQLHPRRQFIAANAGGENVIAGSICLMLPVHRLEERSRRFVRVTFEGAGGKEIVDRRALPSKGNTLVLRREKAVGPIDRCRRPADLACRE